MAVLLLQRHQIADHQWNRFIDTSPQSILYAYTWYLDVVSPDWVALILVENEEWQAVLPLPIRKKWLIWVVQQPFFCQFLGVFTTQNADFLQCSTVLLQNIPAHFRYISVYSGRFPEVNFLPYYEVVHCQTYLLPLNQPYSTLKTSYTPDRQANLNRAQKFNWETKEHADCHPLIDLFRQNHASQIEGGVSEMAYALLKKVFEVLIEKKAVTLRYAITNGQIEAGAIFAIYGKRIIYLFNAASPLGRKGNARTWLIDQIIQEYAESDYIFDFESPEIKSIADFYQSFGAKEEKYLNLHYNGLPFLFQKIQECRQKKGRK